jgi:hypothetical protein
MALITNWFINTTVLLYILWVAQPSIIVEVTIRSQSSKHCAKVPQKHVSGKQFKPGFLINRI